MSVCNCVISVKKCFLSPNNGFLRFCQGKTQVPIKNYILNSTNRITTVLCQKCLAQQAHIIRASTLHPSSTILLLSYIFLCEQKNYFNYKQNRGKNGSFFYSPAVQKEEKGKKEKGKEEGKKREEKREDYKLK